MDSDQRDNHAYNPEKARVYRTTFQERSPSGRTWAEHIAAWRQEHPEYRARSNDYAKKSKRIAKLGLKKRLGSWGLPPNEIPRFLRLLTIDQIERLVLCLGHWDVITDAAPRTMETLLAILGHDDRALLALVLEQVKKKLGK